MLPKAVVRGRKNPLHLGFAERLHRARKAAGWSLAALGREAGIGGAKTASALERGDNIPRVDTVEKLARALKLSPCFLAFGVEQPWDPAMGMLSDGLAKRLREARQARKLPLRALERAAEVAVGQARRIELGSIPTLGTAERLATSLDVSPAWLVFGCGPMEIPHPAGHAVTLH